MAIIQDRKDDRRRYNAPNQNEVAIVFQNSDGEPPLNRDILIHCRSNSADPNSKTCERISILDPNLEPMVYPLFFPYGEQSWGIDIPLQNRPRSLPTRISRNPRLRVTQMQYYSFIFSIRDELNPFLSAGKLTQQYIVDAYVKTEANRLNYIKQNQCSLRIENYKGLMDHLHRQDVNLPGVPVILPSSFQGSPRNMHQNYQDAMAIVRKYGAPDLFITMTCNPKLSEITNNLSAGQHSEFRPDLIARVFNIKLNSLLDEICKDHIFGIVVGHLYVIEFQKRGLPHAHILVILKPESKPTTAEDVDKIVSAEIPNKDTNPRLYEIVTAHMIHGPCGQHNLSSPCMLKGHDCANIEINQYDEVKTFLDSRYISAPEAIWRLFGFKMHNKSHTITRLGVHLPGEHNVVFRPSEIIRAIHNRKDTTLEAWFKLNQNDTFARNYFYYDIPQHYVFDGANKSWKRRQRGGNTTIGRMYTVNMSSDIERYCLRLLLLHIKGATSFEHLRTVNNVVCESFQEAARQLGLINNEAIWENTLEEAALINMPHQLRELFVYICVFAQPPNVNNHYSKFKQQMTEDFVHKHKCSSIPDCQVCTNLCLMELNNIFSNHGKKCSDFNLPNPPENMPVNNDDLYDCLKQLQQSEEMKHLLNQQQLYAFNKIITSIQDESANSKCFFIDGPGGSGKTFLYKTLLSTVRGEGAIALAVASTGIAANLLEGGRTYHSQFKLPIPILETSNSLMRLASNDASILRASKLIIWDESTMASKLALTTVDRLLKEIMNNNKPFGGKTIVLGGDFRQTLRVIPHGNRTDIVETSIKFSNLWEYFEILKLNVNIRSIDEDFSNWLLQIGTGEVPQIKNLENEDYIKIPEKMLSDDIVQDIFGSNLDPNNILDFASKAILCPKNTDVDDINIRVLNKLEGESYIFLSSDSIEDSTDEDMNAYPVEFLNDLTPSGIPSNKLILKIGAIVILLRNLNTRRGLCNGTRLWIKNLKPNLIIAEALTGSAKGDVVFIPRLDLMPSNTELPFVLKRRQFPIKLAFAMTINKSQGQTLEKVGIYLPEPVFTHGQLYVALSRVRTSNDVKIYVKDGAHQGKLCCGNEIYTKNVVFKEIFNT